jgi:phosphoglycerate dehydrogenase-like enzyme
MDLDDLFSWADVVSVHAPALPSTHHLVNAERLARMHDGAWLLNTARGSLVDTDALTRECVAGRLSAFVDTPDPEPLPAESPLYDLPNVVLTPHIAGSLGNEISRMGDLAVDEVRRFLAGEPLAHEVRAEDLARIA